MNNKNMYEFKDASLNINIQGDQIILLRQNQAKSSRNKDRRNKQKELKFDNDFLGFHENQIQTQVSFKSFHEKVLQSYSILHQESDEEETKSEFQDIDYQYQELIRNSTEIERSYYKNPCPSQLDFDF